MGMIKTFGCGAFAKILDAKTRKLDWKAEPCRFLGIAANQNGFILMTEPGQFKVIRDVKGFDERVNERYENENEELEEIIIATRPKKIPFYYK